MFSLTLHWKKKSSVAMRGLPRSGVWLTVLATLLVALPAHAQTTQLWPELDMYIRLNPSTRIFLQASTVQNDDQAIEGDFSVSVDLHLKPLVRKDDLLARLDESKNRAFMLRAGYRRVQSYTAAANENRAQVEATVRYPLRALFGDVLVSNRNRVDFRDIGGVYSWRYRNRLTAERELSAGRARINPYARFEVSYDSRSESWSRNEWRTGSSFHMHKNAELDAYYAWQNNTGKDQTHAVGAILTLYF